MTAVISEKPKNAIDLKTVIQGIDELPTIPETLIQILQVLDDPDSGPSPG